jgi:hypothetical protein
LITRHSRAKIAVKFGLPWKVIKLSCRLALRKKSLITPVHKPSNVYSSTLPWVSEDLPCIRHWLVPVAASLVSNVKNYILHTVDKLLSIYSYTFLWQIILATKALYLNPREIKFYNIYTLQVIHD